jgi:hypothetical protein
MHTRADVQNGSVQSAVHEVAEHARNLARLEVALAASELKQKTAALGAGIVSLAIAGVLVLFALGFMTAAAAAGLATFLPTWSALLVVGGALLVVAGLLLALGMAKIRRGVPPVPEQAVHEAKLTGAVLKGRNSG